MIWLDESRRSHQSRRHKDKSVQIGCVVNPNPQGEYIYRWLYKGRPGPSDMFAISNRSGKGINYGGEVSQVEKKSVKGNTAREISPNR